MHYNKKVLIGVVLGILGCLFIGIFINSLLSENKRLKAELHQVKHNFDSYVLDMQDYETAVYDRGKLSDILRCHYDQCHWNGHSEFSLDSLCVCFGVDKDSVRLWSYSYSY